MTVFDLIKQSGNIVIFTGAGMSTESGLPDFRSNGGLWDGKDPFEISHVRMLKKDPKAITEFYEQLVRDVLEHKPNRGHEILAEWDQKGIITSIVTQNIDGYHQRAGAKNVIELHGNLGWHCWHCGIEYEPEEFLEFNHTLTPWECDDCRDDGNVGLIRPNVVLFGEDLPQSEYLQALQRHVKADLCIVLGSSLSVYPANSLPQHTVDRGGKLVIVNRTETPLDRISSAKIDKMSITEFLEAANGYLTKLE